MLGAYFNPVHSDKNKVASLTEKFREHLKFMNDFKAGYVGSETGSFNDDKWTYNPLNRTEEAFQEVKRIFKDLAKCAEDNNAKISFCTSENLNYKSSNILSDIEKVIQINNYSFII
jgi:sugar phosphate isomerase/epimerase